jgi:diacylglycerol kinase (ATP)
VSEKNEVRFTRGRILNRLILAFQNSKRALVRAYQTEPAVRQELILLAIALPIAWLLSNGLWMFAFLIGSLLIVLAVELVNTAIEKLCDQLHPDRHEAIGYVKDLGSAAVLMTLLLAGMVWLIAIIRWVERTI